MSDQLTLCPKCRARLVHVNIGDGVVDTYCEESGGPTSSGLNTNPPRRSEMLIEENDRVLGLDLAKLTGYCVSDGTHFESGVWDFGSIRDAVKSRHNGHMFEALLNELDKIHNLDAIVYERAHHRGGAATRIALGLVSVTLMYAAQYGIRVFDVHTATLKKWATGDYRAGKLAMMAFASEKTGREITSDDEGDAICVAEYGRSVLKEEG